MKRLKNGTIVLGSLVNGEEGYGRKVVYITEPVFFRALVVTTRHTLFRMVKFNVKVLRLKVQKKLNPLHSELHLKTCPKINVNNFKLISKSWIYTSRLLMVCMAREQRVRWTRITNKTSIILILKKQLTFQNLWMWY